VENQLRHLLDEISAAIDRARHHDDKAELTRLQGAVEGRLEERAGEDDHPGLLDSLEKAEIRFEADHPTLAQSLRQAIQGLSSSGI
jgi:hypothetical protein